MNDEIIKNQIDNTVDASPAITQQEASQPIEAPSYSTLRTGYPEEMPTAPVAQYETTPDRGIEFTSDTDEVITGGTAIPGMGYDTRFKTAADRGDPLYFEPNFQPVVPYPVGNFDVDSVNPNKAGWSIAMATGGWDKDYVGYYRLPEPGSQSWWDFLVGGIQTQATALPATIAKGATNITTSIGKTAVIGAAIKNSIWQGVLGKIMDESPYSDAGSLFNAIAKNYDASGAGTIVDELNNLQDVVSDAVSPLEQYAFDLWDADVSDNSFKANSARGVASGLVSFALAAATKNPEVAFSLLNFANVSEMRHKALDFGVSPGWAEVYSIGGGTVNSLLDMLQFEALVNSASLVKQGTTDYLKNLSVKGLWNGIKQHAPRELAVTAGEMATEMAQTGIEEAYNPEFRKDPTEALAIAALSAFILKAITLPVSVRHANQEDMMRVAETEGVKNIFDQIRAAGYILADDMISKGAIQPEQRGEFVHLLISEAPDVMIKTLREGPKGELDKIPPENRKQMLNLMNSVVQNFGQNVFSPKMFAKLDSETETALGDIRAGISDSEAEMIKGAVHGAYVLSAIANANNPNYEGFRVPKFVVAKNAEGYSYYDRNKNEIGIHEGRSNTEYTNISPDYARRLDSNFVPASRQSDKMASILHEMSHWLDAMVGKKGFGDFLEHYYNNIALAFGKEKARELYTDREGKGKSKGRPSEYFAQTIARLGKRSAEAFGLGKSEANRFLSYANIMMNQLANLEGNTGEKLSKSIAAFQTALQEATKANMEKLSDLIEVYGSDNIKKALANFNQDSEGYGDLAEYLASKDMLQELFDVMDNFSDAAGIEKIKDLFDGDQDAMDNFVTMGDKMFREGYDKAVEEVRQRRVEAKKTAPKPVEAKPDLDLVRTAIGIVGSTTDSSQVHEGGVEHEVGSYTYTLGDGTEVAYDNNDGIGATGTNRYAQEGDWKSAIITMTPDEYLTLSPSMENTPDSVPFIKESIKNGKTIAMPFLLASGYDVEGSAPNTLIVNQHEGRHRAQALKELGVTSMDVVVYGSALQNPKYANGLKGVTLQYSDSNRTVTVTDVLTEPYSRGQINNSMGTGNKDFEKGIQYETQDWAKAALAKDSVKESFEAGKQEKKQIAADTKIDGRDLTDDINMANQGLTQRLKQPMNKFVKWASSSSWGWGLDRILVTILGRDVAEKLDIAGKYSAKQNIRSRYWDEFMARLKPLFGDPKTNTEFMFKYKTMVTNLGFARMTGVEMIDPANPAITSTRDITGWEAMYVYLMKEQGFGDRVQRSTTTNIDDIIATLSEDEKAFALHMSDQLMSMYEKAFGKSKYAHYFPILDAEHELFDELSIDSLMARQNTDDAIAITDAGRIFSQYVSRWASHESNYFQTMKRTRDIFRYTGVDKNEMGPMYTFDLEQDNARKRASAQVAAEVRQVIGEDGYRNLMNLIESELQDGQEQMFDASRNKTLTQMGNNIIKSILANKMMSFPKNIANVFMFWGGAQDQSRYWNSFAEGLGNFKDTFDYMMKHSPEIKQRWGAAGGINEYLDQRTLGGSTAPIMKGVSKAFAKMDWTGDKTQNMAKFSAVMDMLGDAGLKLFMQSGDMIANVYGGYGLVKDFMAQGMSEAEAFRKLDRYIIEHQSSSNLAMKPLVQKLQNKSLMGQVFAFTSEGVAKWASILGTFDEVKMGTATKSEALANVVSIAISMTLYSLLAAGAWDLLDDDEKVQEETVKALGNTLLDQVFGGMVAGNAFITPAISYLVGDSRVSGMSVPIYNFALDGISALKKGEYDRVITKAMSALGMPVGADNLWNTYLGMSLLNDPNPDVRYAGRLMLAGFTPSRSAKRAGIKKENLEKNDEE